MRLYLRLIISYYKNIVNKILELLKDISQLVFSNISFFAGCKKGTEDKEYNCNLLVENTNKEQEILKLVNDKAVSIRHDLAQRTRYQLRTVPTLTFFLDDSLDYLENIDQLLKE